MDSKSKTIIEDFVAFCADQNYPIPAKHSQYCRAMRDLAGQLMKHRHEKLDKMRKLFDKADDTQLLLNRVCVTTFQDHKSLVRLISLFAFAGTLSLRSGQDKAVLCSCISSFIDDNLADWMQSNDCWTRLCRLYANRVKLADDLILF